MEKRTKQKPHYAWVILIACCLLNASALGLSNSNGLFYPEICSELGFQLSAFTVHTIVCGLTSAAALLFVDKAFRKYDTRLILIISLLMFHLSYMVMAGFTTILEFCVASVFTGIGSAFLLYVPVPMLINNWFVKKKKTVLSICFVCSGVSGILCSLLLGWTISAYGWRASFIIRGAILLLMALPVFLIRKTPEEMGLQPYGAGEGETEAKASKVFGESAEKHKFEDKRVKFIAAIVLAVALNLSCGMTIQLPNYAASIGLGIVMGSVLTSLAMVGNISSKAVFGPLTEKIGVVKVSVLVLLCMAGGWLLPGLGLSSTAAIYTAAVVTGFSACANTLVIPNLADTFVTGDEYVHVLARCSTGTMVASAFTTMISSALYDLFGSYEPVFLCYAGLTAAEIAVLILVFGKKTGKKG